MESKRAEVDQGRKDFWQEVKKRKEESLREEMEALEDKEIESFLESYERRTINGL